MFRSFAEKLTLFLGFTAGIAPSPVNAMPTYGLPSNIPDDIDPFQNPFASLDARQDKAKSKRKGKRKSGAQRRREKRDAAATTHNVDGNISGYKITADGITVDVASDFARLNAGSLGRFEQPAINGKAIATRISGKSVIDIPLSSTLANSRGKYYLQFVLRVDLTTNTHTLIYAGPTKAGATAYLTGTLGDGGNKDRSTIIYPTTIDGKDVLLPVGYDDKRDGNDHECSDVQKKKKSDQSTNDVIKDSTLNDITTALEDFLQLLYRDENGRSRNIKQRGNLGEPFDCLGQAQIESNYNNTMPDINRLVPKWSGSKSYGDAKELYRDGNFKLNPRRLTRILEDFAKLPNYKDLAILDSSMPIGSNGGHMIIKYTGDDGKTYTRKVNFTASGYRFNVSPDEPIEVIPEQFRHSKPTTPTTPTTTTLKPTTTTPKPTIPTTPKTTTPKPTIPTTPKTTTPKLTTKKPTIPTTPKTTTQKQTTSQATTTTTPKLTTSTTSTKPTKPTTPKPRASTKQTTPKPRASTTTIKKPTKTTTITPKPTTQSTTSTTPTTPPKPTTPKPTTPLATIITALPALANSTINNTLSNGTSNDTITPQGSAGEDMSSNGGAIAAGIGVPILVLGIIVGVILYKRSQRSNDGTAWCKKRCSSVSSVITQYDIELDALNNIESSERVEGTAYRTSGS